MEKVDGNIRFEINDDCDGFNIFYRGGKVDEFYFENSHDFCKFFLELARDMGIKRFDFAAGCNAVSDEIEGWDNL